MTNEHDDDRLSAQEAHAAAMRRLRDMTDEPSAYMITLLAARQEGDSETIDLMLEGYEQHQLLPLLDIMIADADFMEGFND